MSIEIVVPISYKNIENSPIVIDIMNFKDHTVIEDVMLSKVNNAMIVFPKNSKHRKAYKEFLKDNYVKNTAFFIRCLMTPTSVQKFFKKYDDYLMTADVHIVDKDNPATFYSILRYIKGLES